MRGYTVHKRASYLFDTWQLNQDVFNDDAIQNNYHNEKRLYSYYQNLKKDYKKYPGALGQLEILWHNYSPLLATLSDITQFISYLQQKQFSNKVVYNEERTWSVHKIINKYNKFMRLLCMNMSYSKQNKFLYLLANEFFMFCFNPLQTDIQRMLTRHNSEPLVRMFYAIMWKHFGGRGWQSWHKTIIDNLQEEFQKGNEIVYIAGGSDINQLLRHNIYNIRIIDPFLPTQDTYYSQGWKFLVKGLIGDTITWEFGANKLLLKRIGYKENGSFSAQLSNRKKRRIPHATIVWDIYNENGKKCGQLTIERRFVQQADFSKLHAKKLLISFNELYFITTVGEDSWGIDIQKFDKNFEIYVKQLKNKVSKVMLNKIQQIDNTFEFIQLGNCVN